MNEVFVSYKRENLAAVGRLVEALRAEGVGVWWDQDIPPNAPWEATIEAALAAAKLVIVAWSPTAVASENVKAEARWARGQGRLLQVFVEACEPPLFFGERQGVDLKAWAGEATDAAFRSVLATVREGLSATAPDGASQPEAPPALPTRPSIAVLPFANLSGDPDQDYFADGMVVEVVAALSRFRSLLVIASGSSLALKGKGLTPRQVADQLGVRYLLDGSVRRSADRVRIAVQLIDAFDGTQIWAQRFDDTIDDVFDLQDKVALAVAGAIEPTVRDSEMRRASDRPPGTPGSYDLLLRALSRQRTLDRPGVLAAQELLGRALELEPDYASALAQAGLGHFLIFISGWSDDPDLEQRSAIRVARRALQLAPDDAMILAHAAFIISRLEHDQAAAIALLDRALAVNPGSSMVWGFSGVVRVGTDDVGLALDHLATALRLDPLGPERPHWTGWTGVAQFQQGRFVEAAANVRAWVQQADAPIGQGFLAASYGQLGQIEAARAALERYRRATPMPVEEVLDAFPDETLRRLFRQGIALAEGEQPS